MVKGIVRTQKLDKKQQPVVTNETLKTIPLTTNTDDAYNEKML